VAVATESSGGGEAQRLTGEDVARKGDPLLELGEEGQKERMHEPRRNLEEAEMRSGNVGEISDATEDSTTTIPHVLQR
jgi:hypothetical protein